MASSSRRGMDWPTAWSGIVPVYGFAILLDAVYPLFAVPIWIIFLIYAIKVINGARAAEDPWRGRASPRRYLLPFVAGIIVQDLSLATLAAGGLSGVISAMLGTLVALGAAAWFVAASAPPRIRDERRWLWLGAGSEILSALVLPATLVGSLSAAFDSPAIFLTRLLLAAISLAGFLLASHFASRQTPAVARKVARE